MPDIKRFEDLSLEKQLQQFGAALELLEQALAKPPTEPGMRLSMLRGMASTLTTLEKLVAEHKAGTRDERKRLKKIRERVDAAYTAT